MNYSKDGNNYTSLIINKVSYENSDGGEYLMNISNYCGVSSVFVILNVDKGNMNSNKVLLLCYKYP